MTSSRYDRQVKLDKVGPEGQVKLSRARILIVGVGGLGCPAAQYLAAAGIGHLGLLDHDIVDYSNLHRQILFSENQIGIPKSHAAKDRLMEMNSEIRLTALAESLTIENALHLLEGYDVILDGTDNFQTKYLINDVCVKLGKPFIGASIYKYQGQISVFNYRGGPTYRCFYPTHHLDDISNCEDTGVLGVLPGIMGIIQATEALKLILGVGEPLVGKMKFIDTLSQKDHVIQFHRNEEEVEKVHVRPIQLEQIACEFIDADGTYLDVREYYEEPKPKSLHVINIPLNDLKNNVEKIPRDRQIHVFCQTGIRSKKAIELLTREFGFTNLTNVDGGIENIIK